MAAAHTRVTGRPPARDPERPQYRVYSADELRAALIELSGQCVVPPPQPAPPPEHLRRVWAAALQRLAPLHTRAFLAQQAQLLELCAFGRDVRALVAIQPGCLELAESHRALITRALAVTLDRRVVLALREVGR